VAEAKPKIEVSILNVREYPVGVAPGPVTQLHDILFQAPNMVPLLITLKAEEDTAEGRAAEIRKKIDEEKERKPETIRV